MTLSDVDELTLWFRLDADMLDWFRTQGKGYQTRINAVLRAYYESRRSKDGREAKHTGTGQSR